eukprot:6285171-Amphidinium_carterae.1
MRDRVRAVSEVQTTAVLILDDDGPGTVMFEKEDLTVQEGLEDLVQELASLDSLMLLGAA